MILLNKYQMVCFLFLGWFAVEVSELPYSVSSFDIFLLIIGGAIVVCFLYLLYGLFIENIKEALY